MANTKIRAYSKSHRACEICGSTSQGIRVYSDGSDPTLRVLCRSCRDHELNSFGIEWAYSYTDQDEEGKTDVL